MVITKELQTSALVLSLFFLLLSFIIVKKSIPPLFIFFFLIKSYLCRYRMRLISPILLKNRTEEEVRGKIKREKDVICASSPKRKAVKKEVHICTHAVRNNNGFFSCFSVVSLSAEDIRNGFFNSP